MPIRMPIHSPIRSSSCPVTAVASVCEFERSYLRCFSMLVSRLLARFQNRQLAEESALDSLSSAWERLLADPNYFACRDLLAWTTRRATWRVADVFRLRSRERALPEEFTPESTEDLDGRQLRSQGGWSYEPRMEMEEVFRTQALYDCLERLPARECEVIVRHHFRGQTDQEIGSHLFSAGSIRARGLRVWRLRQRAYHRLRALLLRAGVE